MKKVPELFGSMVFNEAVMKERLPKDVYKSLKQTVRPVSYTHLTLPTKA